MSTSQLKYTVSHQDIFHFPKSRPKICVVKPFPGLSTPPSPATPLPTQHLQILKIDGDRRRHNAMYMTSFTQKILVDSNRHEFAMVKMCEKDVVGFVKYTEMFHVNSKITQTTQTIC